MATRFSSGYLASIRIFFFTWNSIITDVNLSQNFFRPFLPHPEEPVRCGAGVCLPFETGRDKLDEDICLVLKERKQADGYAALHLLTAIRIRSQRNGSTGPFRYARNRATDERAGQISAPTNLKPPGNVPVILNAAKISSEEGGVPRNILMNT